MGLAAESAVSVENDPERSSRRDRNEHLRPRKLTDAGSDLHEPGSMPAVLMTSAAADEVRNLNNTLAASGRGWVVLGTAGRLVGHFYIHNGDDSGFVCDRA